MSGLKRAAGAALSALLFGLSLGPGAYEVLAAEANVKISGPLIAPVVGLNANLSPVKTLGASGLANLPTFNSAEAQAIDAAEMLAVPTAQAAARVQANASLPALSAAIQATAEESKAETALTPTAQLTRIENLSQPTSENQGGGASAEKTTQDHLWSASAKTAQTNPVQASAPRVSFWQRLGKATRVAGTVGVGAAVALDSNIALAAAGAKASPAAPALLPHWLQTLVTHYTPYLTIASAAAVVYGVNRAVQAVIDKVAAKAGWDKSTTVVVKRGTGLGIYGLGAVISMHVGGAPAALTTAVAGLGTTAVTMASKTILGNALEASKVLMYHSFIVGDRIKIGDDTYKVKDLSLRYVTLQNEAFKSSPTNFTYLQLASMPITILHPYEANHKLHIADSGVTFGKVTQSAGKAVAGTRKKTWLWLAGSLAVAIGLSYAAPFIGLPALVTALSFVKGAAVFSVAHNARTIVLDFITKLAEKAGWHPQTALVAKLITEVVSYTIGGSWALRAVGTTWMMLLGGLGTTGLAFTLVTQDILSNLVTAGWLMSDRNKDKSFKIGDYVSVGKYLGKVVDMNFQYVVLDHENGTHTLISYAFIKDNPFSIIAPEDLPAAKTKYAPPAAAPAAPQQETK